MDEYLIWSNEHRAWWRPNCCGYTVHLKAAGRYSREDAIKHSRTRSRDGEIMPEIPVRLDDVLAAEEVPIR